MSEAAAAKKSLYRPELDVVRFLAFLFVFTHHSLPRQEFVSSTMSPAAMKVLVSVANAAGFGLCLFFVLSAYLICDLLLRERNKTGTIRLGAFYKRRILRIWPLYFLGILIGFLMMHRKGEPTAVFLAFLLMVGNWYCAYVQWGGGPFNQLWSVSIEEQFYLFWPWLSKRLTRGAMYLVCGLMIVTANGWLVYFGQANAPVNTVVWANSFVQFEMFAAGILLALILHQQMPRIGAAWRVLLLLACPVSWFVAVYVFGVKKEIGSATSLNLVIGYALAAAGSVALILSLLGVRRESVPRWASYLGRISYGLYVFHVLAGLLASIFLQRAHLPGGWRPPLQLAMTIAIAAVSYRFYETPFLKLKARAEVISTRPI
jgi:peptidoglycan/LPS O-acetylase OafA/YrhL